MGYLPGVQVGILTYVLNPGALVVDHEGPSSFGSDRGEMTYDGSLLDIFSLTCETGILFVDKLAKRRKVVRTSITLGRRPVASK
jgi:hypothetical protein